MSDDLISRQEVIQAIRNERVWVDENIQNPQHHYHIMNETTRILSIIGNLPSVQSKTGRWIFEKGDGKTCVDGYICSACGESFHTKVPYWSEFKFCPCCGARMEETE